MEEGCQRCGLSCMGVRVVPLPTERARLEAHAEALGVAFPWDGDALRLVGGACVFYRQGCALHAAFGAAAKPRVCRQFPYVRRGTQTGVDPGCAHAAAWPEAVGQVLGVEAPPRAALPDGDLRDLAEEVGLTLGAVTRCWGSLPWSAWADQGTAGPLRRAGVERLAALSPPATWPSWPAGADGVRRAWSLGLCDDLALLLTGAVVVAAHIPGDPARQRLFAVWVRTVR